ncbi:pyocin S6 family toxin immunity protein [Pseudomonas chlororaphis]|uniref:pyocin S6 family toxin immunity protein n=1 Tax=Pseudomonas chlororaphis TaxID=587753 RepID=UPI00240855B9|nr:pyocin S6 family toxin immunity protein [Pseudomonas chlororaphis]
MYLCITGFLLNSTEDDSLKYELDVDSIYNKQIVETLGYTSLNAMEEGEWLLTNEQITAISEIIGLPLPTDLKLYIGVEA